jgi:carbamoyltransferase
MNIIGLGGWDHDTNAALLNATGLVAIGEEERFTRVKHKGKQYANSLAFCLGYSGHPTVDQMAIGFRDTAMVAQIIQTVRSTPPFGKTEFSPVDHHHSHAAGAFYLSGFDEAVVVTIDGFGDDLCSTASFMRGAQTETLWAIPYPHSLGGLWMSTCFLLGFGMRDAGKLMGLASYGEARYSDLLLNAVNLHADGSYEFDVAVHGAESFLHSTASLFMPILQQCRPPQAPIKQVHMDVAASLQAVTEAIVMHALHALHASRSSRNLCLSGGVALNSSLNGTILRSSPFASVFIPPNPGDSGTGIGSALHVAALCGNTIPSAVLSSPYLGAEFSQDEIDAALVDRGVACSRPVEIEKAVAQHLAEGRVVGWFQGRAEVGPRALGNRSIVADPRRTDMKELLNSRVKFREWFRPFAPAVIAPKVNEWFEIKTESPYMSFVCPVLPHRRSEIPAVTHVDGTARVQTVRYEQNPMFYRLIREFENITGVPMVVNTSFNTMGEPIVNSPRDAIDCFLKSGIEVLAIGNSLILKPTTS